MPNELHPDSSTSNQDINNSSSSVTNNPCPCQPNSQQKEISQALFRVPEGFQALLKHITRELLNAKPKDPYTYIADFLKTKVNDKRRGLLEQEFFSDDTLNIDIKPPMHYLQQTSLTDVRCTGTSAFDAMANEAATTLQASYRGMQSRGEIQKVKRDPEEQPQFGDQLVGKENSTDHFQDVCAKTAPSVFDGSDYRFKDNQPIGVQQRPGQASRRPNDNNSRRC